MSICMQVARKMAAIQILKAWKKGKWRWKKASMNGRKVSYPWRKKEVRVNKNLILKINLLNLYQSVLLLNLVRRKRNLLKLLPLLSLLNLSRARKAELRLLKLLLL